MSINSLNQFSNLSSQIYKSRTEPIDLKLHSITNSNSYKFIYPTTCMYVNLSKWFQEIEKSICREQQ